ncbi:hypothetical protein ACWA7J_11965 [Leptothrix sp. BB-4]
MLNSLIDAPTLRLLVDVALAISVAELLWSLWRAPSGPARRAVLANLAAGLGLMLGLRLSLSGPGDPSGPTAWAVLACLGVAGLAHLIDVRLRLAAGPPPARSARNPMP